MKTLSLRSSRWPLVVGTSAVLAMVFAAGSLPSAQQPKKVHLSRAVDKLAQGKTIFGVSVQDLTMNNARAVSRMDVDFVRIEMEHMPLDLVSLRNFLIGMTDKAAVLKNGNLQSVSTWARFPPYGSEQASWIAKQALDIGLMGVLFNTVDTKEQAMTAVQSMRYPQPRGSKIMQPLGLRGYGPGNALWVWGVSGDEYSRRADLWPLNPDGDLLALMMIETQLGVDNIEAIASVPGVGVIRPGAAGDLPTSMGLPNGHPEVEAALQKVLKTCLARNIPCGISATAATMQQRIKEGWRYIEMGGIDGGTTAAIDGAMRAAKAVQK